MLLGKILLRLRGVYFVLVTFLAGQVFTLVALNWESVTHGANGLVGIPAISLFGFPLSTRLRFYYFALAAFVMVLTFVWALMRSQYGRAFRSIAENIRLAESSGIDVSHYQVVAFALGSGIAGAAGAPWSTTSASCRRTVLHSTIRLPTSPCWSSADARA